MTISSQRRENLRRAGSMIDRFRQRTASQRRHQAERFLETEGPRIRARRNNSSISGSLDFLNEGRNVPFPYGRRSNGTLLIRSENTHALAKWLLREKSTNPWTREPIRPEDRYRVYRKALFTNNGTYLSESEKREMRRYVRNYLRTPPGSPPPAPRKTSQRSTLRRIFGSTPDRSRTRNTNISHPRRSFYVSITPGSNQTPMRVTPIERSVNDPQRVIRQLFEQNMNRIRSLGTPRRRSTRGSTRTPSRAPSRTPARA